VFFQWNTNIISETRSGIKKTELLEENSRSRLEICNGPDEMPNYQENRRFVGSILPELAEYHIAHDRRNRNGFRNRRKQFMDEGIWNKTPKARIPRQGSLYVYLAPVYLGLQIFVCGRYVNVA
jgi:hypothetical protein